ncbi:MAG: hypothetical protein ABGY95_02475, partial [Rubritalea sp.]|uniref:hypothetical protein n=1 Tax=Rubritalea sp. TaxID=2109375 RepID=UPI0032429727
KFCSENIILEGVDKELISYLKIKQFIVRDDKKNHIQIQLSICDRIPKIDGSSGLSGIQNDNIYQALPKKKIHIKGSLLVRADHFRELEPSPLSQAKQYSQQGMKLESQIDRFDELVVKLSTRNSSLLLASQVDSTLKLKPKYTVTHPSANIPQNRSSSGRGSNGLFGSSSDYEYDILHNLSPNSYEIKKLHKIGYTGTIDNWINEASLTISVYDHSTYHRLNLDLTLEVANPEKVIELLKKNR